MAEGDDHNQAPPAGKGRRQAADNCPTESSSADWSGYIGRTYEGLVNSVMKTPPKPCVPGAISPWKRLTCAAPLAGMMGGQFDHGHEVQEAGYDGYNGPQPVTALAPHGVHADCRARQSHFLLGEQGHSQGYQKGNWAVGLKEVKGEKQKCGRRYDGVKIKGIDTVQGRVKQVSGRQRNGQCRTARLATREQVDRHGAEP